MGVYPRTYQPAHPEGHPLHMKEVDQYHARQLNANIERSILENNSRFRTAAQKVVAQMQDASTRRANGENVQDPYPGASPNMVEDITRQYEASTKKLAGEIRELYRRGPNDAPPDRRWIQSRINGLNNEHTIAFQKKIHAQYGVAGDNVLQGIAGQAQSRGPLGTIMSKLSTVGGLIGGLGAGYMAFSAMGGMQGGLMAIIGGVVGLVAGGVVGGSINEYISGESRPKPAPIAPETAVAPDKTVGKGKGTDKGAPAAGAGVDEPVAGDLSAPSFPAQRPTNTRNAGDDIVIR